MTMRATAIPGVARHQVIATCDSEEPGEEEVTAGVGPPAERPGLGRGGEHDRRGDQQVLPLGLHGGPPREGERRRPPPAARMTAGVHDSGESDEDRDGCGALEAPPESESERDHEHPPWMRGSRVRRRRRSRPRSVPPTLRHDTPRRGRRGLKHGPPRAASRRGARCRPARAAPPGRRRPARRAPRPPGERPCAGPGARRPQRAGSPRPQFLLSELPRTTTSNAPTATSVAPARRAARSHRRSIRPMPTIRCSRAVPAGWARPGAGADPPQIESLRPWWSERPSPLLLRHRRCRQPQLERLLVLRRRHARRRALRAKTGPRATGPASNAGGAVGEAELAAEHQDHDVVTEKRATDGDPWRPDLDRPRPVRPVAPEQA